MKICIVRTGEVGTVVGDAVNGECLVRLEDGTIRSVTAAERVRVIPPDWSIEPSQERRGSDPAGGGNVPETGPCGREHRYVVRAGGGQPQYEGPDFDAAVSAAAASRGRPGAEVAAYHSTFLAYVYCDAGTRLVTDAAAQPT